MSKEKAINYEHWYTDEQLTKLINLQIEQCGFQEQVSVADPVLFRSDTGHLQGSLRNSISEVLLGENHQTIIIPINLDENHWASMVIGKSDQGDLRVVYSNPLGIPLQDEEEFAQISYILTGFAGGDVRIIDLSHRQQINGNDCGPFTVDNAIKIASSFQRSNSGIRRRLSPRISEEELRNTIIRDTRLLQDIEESNIQARQLRDRDEVFLPGLHSAVAEESRSETKKRSRTKGTRADIIHENGRVQVKNWDRPSGTLPGGLHGDHTTAWISSIHAIRRIVNNLDISDTESLDQLRPARGNIYDNLSAIAILDGDWRDYQEEGSLDKTIKYTVNLSKGKEGEKGEPYLYEKINDLLDEYNDKRQELSKLDIIERLLVVVGSLGEEEQAIILSQMSLSDEQQSLIASEGGIAAIGKESVDKSKRANADLICQTFMDMIYETSISYYTIPGTTYRKIPGYEAPDSEGSQIRTALARLDKVFDTYKDRNVVDVSSVGTTEHKAVSLLDVSREVLNQDLEERRGQIKPATTPEDQKKQKEIEIQIGRLEKYMDNPLGYIAIKLKDTFYYPEIPAEKLKKENRDRFDRTNDVSEFYNKVAKHLFTYSNIYPELDISSPEGNTVLKLFLQEIATSQVVVKSGGNYESGERGWPSLREVGSRNVANLDTHKQEVLGRVNDLNQAKKEHLYANTLGLRKRLSSTSVELVKASIIAQTLNIVKEDLTQDEGRLKQLEDDLSKISLKKGEEEEFRERMLEDVQLFFIEDRIAPDKFRRLEKIIGLEKENDGRPR